MTKPTLVQSILNLPSQTYSNGHSVDGKNNPTPSNHANTTRPVKKDYYSTKQEMIRIAASMAQAERMEVGANGYATTAPAVSKRPEPIIHSSSSNPHRAPPLPRAQSHAKDESDFDDDDDDSDLDAFFTPNTSPRTSMASSTATVKFPTSRKPSRRSLTSSDSHQPLQIPDTAEHPVPKVSGGSSAIAHTPAAVPSTRTPSTSSSKAQPRVLSSNSSLSSNSLEAHSVFSDDVESRETTLHTSPHPSNSNHSKVAARSTSTSSKHRSLTDQGKKTVSQPTGSNAPSSYKATKSSVSSIQNLEGASSSSTTTPKKSITSASTSQIPNSTSASDTATPTSSTKSKEREKDKHSKDKDTVGYGTVTILPSNKPSASATARPTKTYVSPKQPHTFSAFASVSSGEPAAASTPHVKSSSSSSASASNGHSSLKTSPSGSASASQSTERHRSSPAVASPAHQGSVPTPFSSSSPTQKSARHASAPPAPKTSTSKPLPTTSSSISSRPVSDAHGHANANAKAKSATSSDTPSHSIPTPPSTPPSTAIAT
ncbi:hypothetical protein CPB84DRAFT_1825473, partial [Gymnopilus junonius]